MTTYIVESWKPDSVNGDSKVSCRIMERDINVNDYSPEWRYRKTTHNEWDWALDGLENHKLGVIFHTRTRLQKDPITVERGGDTVRGKLWIVTVTT